MGILFALAAAASWGVSDFLGGQAEAATEDDRTPAITAWTTAIGLLGMLVLSVSGQGSLGAGDAVLAAAGGIGGAVGIAALYRGLSIGTISVVAPTTGVLAATVPVLVGVAAGERPSGLVWIGILLAIGAITLVAREEPVDGVRTMNRTAMGYAVVAGLGFAAIFVVLDAMPDDAGFWPLVPMKLGSTVTAVTWMLVGGTPRTPHPSTWWPVVGVGVLDNAANVAYLLATRHGLLSIVAVLSSLYPAFTVLLARLVLKERLQVVQLVGMGLAGAGVTLIAAG